MIFKFMRKLHTSAEIALIRIGAKPIAMPALAFSLAGLALGNAAWIGELAVLPASRILQRRRGIAAFRRSFVALCVNHSLCD